MKDKGIGLNTGQFGAFLFSLINLVSFFMIIFLSREQLSFVYFPFMTAFHENFLPLILPGFSIFYFLLGLGIVNKNVGFFIGITHGVLGLLSVLFRSEIGRAHV